ncbi:MAG: PAS domain S-box protein [Euryarchaeota archaeon]|nr:PAS domain S-box protein [Euryarchaeota archaeon]
MEWIGGILDTLVDAVVLAGTDGRIAMINRRAEELFGYRREELVGRKVEVLIPERFRGRFRSAFRRFSDTGELKKRRMGYYEAQACRKDGEEVPVEISVSRLEVDGRVYALAIIRDITERKRIERALRESEELFRTLAEYSLVGVYLIQDGVFRYVNPRLAEIFGYEVEELVDRKGPRDLTFREDWPVVRENLEKRLKGEVMAICYDFRGVRKNGEVFYVEVYGARVSYRGRPAVVGTLLDITDRKIAEEKIKHLNSVLSAIRGINQAIVRERNRERLLQTVCELLNRVRGYSIVAVWLLGGEKPEPVALVGDRGRVLAGRRTVEEAVSRREPVVVPGEEGSAAVLPLVHGGRVYGALCVCSEIEGVFDSEELTLLEEMAEDIAYALKAIEAEELRRRAEEELKRRKAFYETIIHSATDMILVVNPEGRFIYANSVARRVLGEDVVGKHIRDVVAPEYVELALRNFKRRLRGERIPPYIIQAIDRHGRRRWTEINGSRIVIDGRVVGTCAIARDVSARRKLEEEVLQAKEFLHSILESSADAIIATDREGRITYFSRGAEEMLGYKASQVAGKPFSSLFPRELREEGERLFEQLVEKEILKNIRTRLQCVEGRTIEVNLSLALLRDSEGRPMGSVGVAKDITREVRAEEAMRRAYEELKRLDQLKSDIIANVSHEIRTPITIAKGYIELAKEEKDEAERIAELEAATRALMRLNDIVEDLISIADIERGDFKLKPREVEVWEVVVRALEAKEELARSKEVSIGVELKYTGKLFADSAKLQRVLMNLLDNAIKFNRRGGEVRMCVERSNGEVLFSVSDTGIGIPEERLGEIFKPLTQLDPSSTRHYGGTGTGLAVAKRIVEAHGGRIWVESTPGEGSTFYFTVPLHLPAPGQ